MGNINTLIYLLMILSGLGLIGLVVWEIKEGKEILTLYFGYREADKWCNPVFFWYSIFIKTIIGLITIGSALCLLLAN